MVWLVVRIMFALIIIDLSIAFAWVGILGFMELREAFNNAFPDAHLHERIKGIYEHYKKNRKAVQEDNM